MAISLVESVSEAHSVFVERQAEAHASFLKSRGALLAAAAGRRGALSADAATAPAAYASTSAPVLPPQRIAAGAECARGGDAPARAGDDGSPGHAGAATADSATAPSAGGGTCTGASKPAAVAPPAQRPTPPPAAAPSTPATVPSKAPAVPDEALYSREQLEVLAGGNISEVFGQLFAELDKYERLVRMPEPPLLLADRVMRIEGEPGTMGTGRIVTETDVDADAWYMHVGRMSPGVVIESGQADLLLASWLGADFSNRGERVYRLLGCDLTFMGELPQGRRNAALRHPHRRPRENR